MALSTAARCLQQYASNDIVDKCSPRLKVNLKDSHCRTTRIGINTTHQNMTPNTSKHSKPLRGYVVGFGHVDLVPPDQPDPSSDHAPRSIGAMDTLTAQLIAVPGLFWQQTGLGAGLGVCSLQ